MIQQLGIFKEKKWFMIPFSIVKSHIKLVTSMMMMSASFFVSHSNIVSIFDLRNNKWIQNLKFDHDIIKIVKTYYNTVRVCLSNATF